MYLTSQANVRKKQVWTRQGTVLIQANDVDSCKVCVRVLRGPSWFDGKVLMIVLREDADTFAGDWTGFVDYGTLFHLMAIIREDADTYAEDMNTYLNIPLSASSCSFTPILAGLAIIRGLLIHRSM